jgi:hypothetical protein
MISGTGPLNRGVRQIRKDLCWRAGVGAGGGGAAGGGDDGGDGAGGAVGDGDAEADLVVILVVQGLEVQGLVELLLQARGSAVQDVSQHWELVQQRWVAGLGCVLVEVG